MVRSTEEVFNEHLQLRLAGDTETDIARNYSENVVLLTANSHLYGHNAIRTSANRLEHQLPNAKFEILRKITDGRFAFLTWRATSTKQSAIDGADSFVVEGGKIVFQSIHYRLVSNITR